jgi:hypothetical protein
MLTRRSRGERVTRWGDALRTVSPFHDERTLASGLTVLFGAAFWQLNHILLWLSGLTFAQVQANPSLAINTGEVKFDTYRGFAKLILLGLGFQREREVWRAISNLASKRRAGERADLLRKKLSDIYDIR